MASLYDSASLVMIPSGVKEDKLYSIKPTDGSGDFTFSRGSDIQATRVNSSGLIEKARVNNLLQSNTFDTNWGASAVNLTSGQSGYDGSSDAWLIENTGNLISYVFQSLSQSGVQTFSIYAKGGNVDWMRVNAIVSGANANAYFDITNGTIGTSTGAAIDKTITSAGNGFYRISLSFNDTINQIRIHIADGDGDESTPLGSNIYIQDAQLNYGLVAQDYVETTTTAVVEGLTADLPRLDYSGGASCPSLLLEPSRTNVWKHSEYLDYSFSSISGITITQNTTETLSPEGLYNASKLSGTGVWYLRDAISGTNTGTYTISCYVKAVNPSTNNKFRLLVAGNNFSSDLTATSEWQRFEHTITDGGSTTAGLFVDTSSNDADLYIYGFQVESGSYPTSYIPTYGAAANRGLDNAITSSYNFGNSAFSILFEHDPIQSGLNGAVGLISVEPLDFYLRYTNDDIFNIWNQDGNAGILFANIGRNSSHKILMVYDGVGSTDVYIDGVKTGNTYSYTWPDYPYNIKINPVGAVGGNVPVPIKQVLIFETALTDAEAIALTTI